MEAIIVILFSAIDHTIKLIEKYRSAAQQSGEWTAEQEAAYKARRAQVMSQAHWQVDPDPS